MVTNYVRTENLSLQSRELNIFSEEIIAEMTGYVQSSRFSKIQPLPISDKTHQVCFVERFGRLYETKSFKTRRILAAYRQ